MYFSTVYSRLFPLKTYFDDAPRMDFLVKSYTCDVSYTAFYWYLAELRTVTLLQEFCTRKYCLAPVALAGDSRALTYVVGELACSCCDWLAIASPHVTMMVSSRRLYPVFNTVSSCIIYFLQYLWILLLHQFIIACSFPSNMPSWPPVLVTSFRSVTKVLISLPYFFKFSLF